MILNKETIFFLLHQPPLRLARFVLGFFLKLLKNNFFTQKIPKQKNADINLNISFSYLSEIYIEFTLLNKKTATYLVEKFKEHRFNLLGSGWVGNSYNSEGLGVEGNLYNMNVEISKYDLEGEWLKLILSERDMKRSMHIWELISDDFYIPIDWQKDYKSNFRWDQKLPFDKQRQLTKPGADIKVPWELSRFQHLPPMAIFAHAFPELTETILKEFRNQILDFIATNPYAMGANWNCPMDVGIRAANILVAYDILKPIDSYSILDNSFDKILANAMYEHGLFIASHLEYSELITSNHYLSNICGLLFISAYLNNSEEINCWLAFSVQEFFNEFEKQFHQDGSNFEASTSYHRLSGELISYGIALIKGLEESKKDVLFDYDVKHWHNKPSLKPINKQLWENGFGFIDKLDEKLFRLLQFSKSITKSDDEIIQIGDNDSGRFIKFTPVGAFLTSKEAEEKYNNLRGYVSKISSFGDTKDSLYWDENCLNHLSLQKTIEGIFKGSSNKNSIEVEIIKNFSKNKLYKQIKLSKTKMNLKTINLSKLKYSENKSFEFGLLIEITELEQHFYPDFGFYAFKTDKIFAGIFAGPSGQNGIGGHSHNDKLSVFLTVDGKNILADPGTYLYTPSSAGRNKFRSSFSHNVPVHNDCEQESLKNGLFQLIGHHRTNIVSCSPSSISILYKNKKIKHLRKIEINNNRLIITDSSNTPFKQNFNKNLLFSNGYGKKINI